MLFKLPIISRDAEAVEKVRKHTLKFVKKLRHVPYEAALQQLRLFSRTHRRFRGDLMPMFMVTHALLEFPIQHTKGYAFAPKSSTNRDVVPAVANTLSAFGLPQFGISYRLR